MKEEGGEGKVVVECGGVGGVGCSGVVGDVGEGVGDMVLGVLYDML